jgi:hypothetical protein
MPRCVNLLLVIAFAVRSLLPVGFMLASTPGDSGVQIIICTGHGPQSWTLDERGVPHPAKSTSDAKSNCPYAPVAAVDAHAPHLLVHSVRYAAVTYAITSELFRATPKPGAQSARGPLAALI